MTGLSCHSCGGSNQPNGSAAYIECQYCGSSISVAAFFKDSSTNSIQILVDAGLSEDETKNIARLFDAAGRHLELNEFDLAKKNLEQILKIHPSHIPSRLNLANCIVYDEKLTPLERGVKVREYVQHVGTMTLDTPDILALKESLAFNLAAMGEKLTNGIDAMKLIQISSEMLPVHKERDALANRFFKNLHGKLDAKVRQGLKESGKKYSPTQTDIEIMVVGSSYTVGLANLCAAMLYHFKNNKDSIHQKILALQDRVKEGAAKADNEVTVFTFSLFNGIKEKQISKSALLS